jgi:hypothetical protein
VLFQTDEEVSEGFKQTIDGIQLLLKLIVSEAQELKSEGRSRAAHTVQVLMAVTWPQAAAKGLKRGSFGASLQGRVDRSC